MLHYQGRMEREGSCAWSGSRCPRSGHGLPTERDCIHDNGRRHPCRTADDYPAKRAVVEFTIGGTARQASADQGADERGANPQAEVAQPLPYVPVCPVHGWAAKQIDIAYD
jgi:hypothetical protein